MRQHWLDEMDGLIIEGDILDALARLEDESVEAIITDPPYELKFMGKAWDDRGVSFRAATWEACLRVLKPGGHMVVFGGARTHHRMWCAVEDAGFEVRDALLWLYGQGMPKSYNVGQAVEKLQTIGAARRPDRDLGNCTRHRFSGDAEGTLISDTGGSVELTTEDAQQWAGWGTGLKPSVEPILLARKPLAEQNVAANVLKFGTGALNIDTTRLEYQGEADKASAKPQGRTTSRSGRLAGKAQGGGQRSEFERPEQKGRWPANVVLQCTCDDPQPVPEKVRKRRGERSQERRYDRRGVTNLAAKPGPRREGGGFIHQPDCPAGMLDEQVAGVSRFFATMRYSDTEAGAAASVTRFKYCPKATKKEREQGLDDLELVLLEWESWEGEAREAKLLVDTAPSPPKVIDAFGLGDTNEWSTLLFGSGTVAPSLQDTNSTIEMKTNSTTESGTLSWLTRSLTSDYTVGANSEKESGGSRAESADDFSPKLSIIVERSVSLPVVGRVRSGMRLTLNGNAGSPATHPAVKPIALMRWLVRLVTPPDGVVLDPFCGSGSTLVAATEEGFGFIGIDISREYCGIALQRLKGRNA